MNCPCGWLSYVAFNSLNPSAPIHVPNRISPLASQPRRRGDWPQAEARLTSINLGETSCQIAMPFVPSDGAPENARWLGLAIDHRRLFDALQDGWLRPLPSRTGVLLGIGTYAPEHHERSAGHRIAVGVKLASVDLPALDLPVWRGRRWVTSGSEQLEAEDKALYWPGALPAFAISELAVSTEEERARLTGLAQMVSNVPLADIPVRVCSFQQRVLDSSEPPPETACKLVVQDGQDAIHGALSMAVWGVPRIDPWMDVLTASLASDPTRLQHMVTKVEVSWWQFPPWARLAHHRPPSLTAQECIWLAAIEVFRNTISERRFGRDEQAERIASLAFQIARSAYSHEISDWLQSTQSVLRGEAVIELGGWRDCPVGLAVQLVLTRSEPKAFKEWFKELPDLPPGVAWTAATLCGLLHGYKRLETHFRGDAAQRKILSIHSFHVSCDPRNAVTWKSIAKTDPVWSKKFGEFFLSWNDTEFARKPEKARGKWLTADLEDATVAREAQTVAKQLDWPCIDREMALTDDIVTWSGAGTVAPENALSRLAIRGEIRMKIPSNAVIEDTLNIEAFRHLVSVERGLLVEPPIAARDPIIQIESPDIPGLVYVPEFLRPDEENHLASVIDGCDWEADSLRRRVQQYGWKYNYKTREIDMSMRLGPLPNWAHVIAQRLVSTKLLHDIPDQVIVNEYVGDQGIRAHVDRVRSFGDGIVMISLLESWEMIFREQADIKNARKVPLLLKRRSAAIMTGDARYLWTHEIPSRKYEPSEGGKTMRGRRISLTFRKVLVETPQNALADSSSHRQ